jgi:hypothetical protein
MLVDSFGGVSKKELEYAIHNDANIQAVAERCRIGYAKVIRKTDHDIQSLKIAGGCMMDLVLGNKTHNDIDVFIDIKAKPKKSRKILRAFDAKGHKKAVEEAYTEVAACFFGHNEFTTLSEKSKIMENYAPDMTVFEGTLEGVTCKVQLINYSKIKPFDWICAEIFYDVMSGKVSGHGLDLFMILPTNFDIGYKQGNRLKKYVERGIPMWKYTPDILNLIMKQNCSMNRYDAKGPQGLALGLAINGPEKEKKGWLTNVPPTDIVKARTEYELYKDEITYIDSKKVQTKPCVNSNHSYLRLVEELQGYKVKQHNNRMPPF